MRVTQIFAAAVFTGIFSETGMANRLATAIVGGFLVTRRMLAMFQKS